MEDNVEKHLEKAKLHLDAQDFESLKSFVNASSNRTVNELYAFLRGMEAMARNIEAEQMRNFG